MSTPTPPTSASSESELAAPSSHGHRPRPWLRVLIPAVLALVWIIGGSVGGMYFDRVEEVSTNDRASFLPETADATQVNDRLADFLGGDSIPAIVIATGDGDLSEADIRALERLVDEIADVPGVDGDVSPPLLSEDGEAAQVIVPIDAEDDPHASIESIRELIADQSLPGLDVQVTGPAGFLADLTEGFLGIDGLLLAVALIAVFVILVIVYRSPLLPLLVLSTSMFALCVSLLIVWWLAKADVFVMNGQVQGILFILVIGAATDYALLYVARFREAVADGAGRWDAATRAWRGSFEAILASGGTVIAGLMCMLLSDLATNRALGPIASIGIVVAVLSALTFLPALLALIGRAAFWPFFPKPRPIELPDDPQTPVHGFWPRQARLIARRPRAVWIACTLLLLAGATGIAQLKADGVPASEFVLGASEARDGQTALAEHFPAGSGSPVYIVVPEDDLVEVIETLDATEGLDDLAVASEDSPSGQAPVVLQGGVPVFIPLGPPGTPEPEPTVSDGDVLLIATLTDAADSTAAKDTVRDLRAELDDTFGAGTVLVGGETATDIDSIDTSIRDRNLIIPIILAVVLLILMALCRAIVAPLLLIATVVLSFSAAMGVSALVFNHVLDFPGADPSVPLYGFVFLVALGVDYNIFLMSRVREESLTHGTRRGTLRGLIATGGVIVSAGLVLAATFAALGVIPILFLAQIAFIVAFGVLLYTLLVCSLLVPALSYDIGRAIWWPSRLSRRREDQQVRLTAAIVNTPTQKQAAIEGPTPSADQATSRFQQPDRQRVHIVVDVEVDLPRDADSSRSTK